jgi:hypothetical protein
METQTELIREAGPDLDADIEEAFFGAVGRNEPKHYSTELEPAAVILDKLHQKGYFWRIDSVPKGVIFTVQCLVPGGKDPKNPDRRTFQIGAQTIPLAICLGALKTVGK